MQKTIIPAQCIGIMGGGQLGRMLAISAKQMGYKIAILEPETECPAKQFADYHIVANYDDYDGLNQLIQKSDVITTEFENVPATSMEYLSSFVGTYPNHKVIRIASNRLLEKQFFNSIDIKTTKFIKIDSNTKFDDNNIPQDLFPAILKTNTLGYDGKGQIRVKNIHELYTAFNQLNQVECILEQMLNLKKEVSIIVARNQLGVNAYPVIENIHKNGILDISIASPDIIHEETNKTITKMALDIVKKLDYIGILAIEFFITGDNQILANEMAPRPHNSGHYTIDACATSQFEQQLRAICNLKLGATTLYNNAIMLNLLGDIWQSPHMHPNWDTILTKFDNIKLHLYEKQIAKSNRKMGHLTLIGTNSNNNNIEYLTKQILEIKSLLNINSAQR